ncbi:hypothetical protein HYC85_021450 [Camellia sinensis]|uniref:Uncharacterized protein n=1 Tax=Camellia sinensis TaxID=4442 RepID=A0A7J7GHR1_CAMSI|nr:hypothetical protein HYC85_021450 [Camellia sinensis]
MARWNGGNIEAEGHEGSGVLILLVALVSLILISAIIFSCADGVSKDKTSAAQTDTYGAGCGAGCGC